MLFSLGRRIVYERETRTRKPTPKPDALSQWRTMEVQRKPRHMNGYCDLTLITIYQGLFLSPCNRFSKNPEKLTTVRACWLVSLFYRRDTFLVMSLPGPTVGKTTEGQKSTKRNMLLLAGYLLNVPVIVQCVSGTDLLGQLNEVPH